MTQKSQSQSYNTMYPPVDYPVSDDNNTNAVVGNMTYAALLARYEAEEPITNDMIQSASASMEAAQHLPNAVKPGTRSAQSGLPGSMFNRLLGVIR